MIPLAYMVGSWADSAGPKWPLVIASLTGFISILLFNSLKLPKNLSIKPTAATAAKFSLRDQWELVSNNRKLVIMLAATTFAGFGNMLSNPLYQIIQVQVLELSNSEIGFARVSYFVGLLMTYLIAGRLIDRIDIKYVLLCGIAAYAIVPMLYGLWGTYPAVILGNGIQGIGEAIWDIGILAFIFRLAPGREAAVFGIHLMLFGIRGTVGPLLGAVLSDSVQLSILLVGASFFGWIGTVIFLLGNWKKSKSNHLTASL